MDYHGTRMKAPLFVDLDGTLIRSDMLLESILALVKQNCWYIFLLPLWLLRGKAYFKARIAALVDVAVDLLPYNEAFLEFLKTENRAGRELVLATATNTKFAVEISDYLGIFSSVICSDNEVNLSGKRKLNAILKLGHSEFSYAGNANIDLEILKHAASGVIVEPDRRFERNAPKVTIIERVFKGKKTTIKSFIKAIRIHQWVKNLLIFVPLILAHLWTSEKAIVDSVIGFFVFGLAASSVYLLNDMLDLDSDRNHPIKKRRPFASGQLSLVFGFRALVILLVLSLSITLLILPVNFLYVLVFYLFLTLAYSVKLKSYVLIDVITLAILYTVRVIAGVALIDVVPSFWLLAFSMFMFLSLALVKRCSELYTIKSIGREAVDGRDYNVADLMFLQTMGIASGFLSVLVIALFIDSSDVLLNYQRHQILWLICPAVLYWISRIWIKTTRGQMDDDPIVYSIRDKGSQIIAFLVALIIFGAAY